MIIHPISNEKRSLAIIICMVMAAHSLLMCGILFYNQDAPKIALPTTQRLIVQTVELAPPSKISEFQTITFEPPSPMPPPIENQPSLHFNKTLEEEPVEMEEKKHIEMGSEKTVAAESSENTKPEKIVNPQAPPASPTKVNNPSKPKLKKAPPTPKTTSKPAKPKPQPKESAKKIEQKSLPPPKKNEIPKKEKTDIKNSVKPKPKEQAAKAKVIVPSTNINQAALENQKKIEAEQQAFKLKKQELLAQARETIAKIDKNRDSTNPGTASSHQLAAPPTKLMNLQIDGISDTNKAEISDQEGSYRRELVGRLKLLLKLPEYGEVKIKLTLERSGKVVNLVIVTAESVVNRKYIEKMVPPLSFPSFGTNFEKAEKFTFSITFSNDL